MRDDEKDDANKDEKENESFADNKRSNKDFKESISGNELLNIK